MLESNTENLLVRVVDTTHKSFSKLTDEDAKNDGFNDLGELKETLKRIYPELRERSIVTIIHFEQVCGILSDNEKREHQAKIQTDFPYLWQIIAS